MLSPLVDPMFARGSGIIGLSLGAATVVPLPPRWVYTGLELGALGGCLVAYAAVSMLRSAFRAQPRAAQAGVA